MLTMGDVPDFVFCCEGNPPGETRLTLATRYMEVVLRHETSATGNREVWTKVKTRPAFEVALLKRTAEGPTIILMEKRRLATDEWRTKVPGGYHRQPGHKAIARKLELDLGIEIDVSSLQLLGHLIGHSEIETPVTLYWTTGWRVIGTPREGVRWSEVPLQRAVQLAMDHRVENDSSFAVLMRLYFLMQEGMLALI